MTGMSQGSQQCRCPSSALRRTMPATLSLPGAEVYRWLRKMRHLRKQRPARACRWLSNTPRYMLLAEDSKESCSRMAPRVVLPGKENLQPSG